MSVTLFRCVECKRGFTLEPFEALTDITTTGYSICPLCSDRMRRKMRPLVNAETSQEKVQSS